MMAGGMGAGLGFAMANQFTQGQQGGQGQTGGGQAPPTSPPPIPQGPKYFAAIGGQQAGPFDEAGLRSQIESGSITRETLVWTEGMADWTAASEVDAVSKLFGSVPPPLPPA